MVTHDMLYPHLDQKTLAAVDWFAEDMKRALEKNHAKGDRRVWLADDSNDLLKRVREETDELDDALRDAFRVFYKSSVYSDVDRVAAMQRIIEESADVGNFAMMLADKARQWLREADGLMKAAELPTE